MMINGEKLEIFSHSDTEEEEDDEGVTIISGHVQRPCLTQSVQMVVTYFLSAYVKRLIDFKIYNRHSLSEVKAEGRGCQTQESCKTCVPLFMS